jgi:hypothetical protein
VVAVDQYIPAVLTSTATQCGRSATARRFVPAHLGGVLSVAASGVPSPRHKYGDRDPDLTEIYLRL